MPPSDLDTLLQAAARLGPAAFAGATGGLDASPAAGTLAEAMTHLLREHPEAVQRALTGFYEAQRLLWEHHAGQADPTASPRPPSSQWTNAPWFRFLREQHAIWARLADDLAGLASPSDVAGRRFAFALRQAVDASHPDNFFATNPEALRRAIDSGGESVRRGLENLRHDLARGQITRSDATALAVGRDLAVTPGAVIHETAVAQVIQYRPMTGHVHPRPLLIVPPFINRHYILDLRPENSFVRFAVSRGFQVFLVSWRSATEATAAATWDDYLRHGVMDALAVALDVTGARRASLLGHCVGGTLAATAAAVLAARGDRRLASLTLLTTLLDFEAPGELGLFVDPAQADVWRETPGVVAGTQLAAAFASLRARELVWHFVERNYLFGETPPVMDLLHWNGDPLDIPAPLLGQYLRTTYLDNALARPAAARCLDTPVDFGRVDVPAYALAARRDHIVPWASAYRSALLLGGACRFVLSGGGHVAGVVDPPGPQARGWVGGDAIAPTPEEWLHGNTVSQSSWWEDWARWLARHAGRRRPAPTVCGNLRHPPVAAAPGCFAPRRVQGQAPAAG